MIVTQANAVISLRMVVRPHVGILYWSWPEFEGFGDLMLPGHGMRSAWPKKKPPEGGFRIQF
jgi:hypothetical protein